MTVEDLLIKLISFLGRDPFNQNSNRSDREKRTTSKGGPVFSKLFRLDRTDPLSFGPKFPEILVEWIAPLEFRQKMSSLREIRELLVDFYMNGVLSDEEFVVLYDENRSKNLDLPYDEYGRFDLDEMADSECISEFRVKKSDLPKLRDALQILDSFTCYQKSVSDGMEGLCMLLRSLAYPCRYSDKIPRFGRPTPVLSMVTNEVLDFIYNTHSHKITEWNHALLSPALLQTYADAVNAKGAALNNCFGFIDGTVRPIARPGENQRVVYNGHKRVHALKFQSLALPNGMIANMFGPVGEFIFNHFHR